MPLPAKWAVAIFFFADAHIYICEHLESHASCKWKDGFIVESKQETMALLLVFLA